MNSYIELAKKAVESYVEKGEIIEVLNNLPKEMIERKSGTFVTIETSEPIRQAQGKLRGCIGTYLPTKKNIAEEIIQNAIAAATEDYRFGSIEEKELSSLSYTVYILSEPELVKDISELDPKKYGIIVKTTPITYPRPIGRGSPLATPEAANGTDVVFNGHFVSKSALLLPDLKGVNTVEQQISITCRKGGIDPSKEKIIIYKFKVEKHS